MVTRYSPGLVYSAKLMSSTCCVVAPSTVSVWVRLKKLQPACVGAGALHRGTASGRAGNLEPSWPETLHSSVGQVLSAWCLSFPLCTVVLILLFAPEALIGIFRSAHCCLPRALALL